MFIYPFKDFFYFTCSCEWMHLFVDDDDDDGILCRDDGFL